MNKNIKKILDLNDLYQFFSTKKKSMNFNSDKTGYNISVQVKGNFETEESDISEGLLYGKIKAFHDLGNENKSYIDTAVLESRMATMKDRPLMADIVDTENMDEDGNPIKDFNGHSMVYDEKLDKFIYIEHPVGHFVNPENFHLEYDEKYQRNFVMADCVVYEEYSDTCEILRRKQETACSVELIIKDMAWNVKEKLLVINDFYVQGCTLLGDNVMPGMAGSKLSLKDFSESNNSLFSFLSETENSKLIDTLEKLNNTLSKFNIEGSEESKENQGKEDNETVEKVIKEVEEKAEDEKAEVKETETKSTEEDVTVTEATVENTPEVVEEDEACGTKKKKCSEKDDLQEDEACGGKKKKYDDTTDGDGNTETTTTTESDTETEGTSGATDTEDESTQEEINEDDNTTIDSNKKGFSKLFELSHEDTRNGLYSLLEAFCDTDNEWYWISEVYDSYFVYEGCCNNKVYKQSYKKDGDEVSFEGDRIELFKMLLTESEKVELDKMRTNYSSIEKELNTYKDIELMSKKEEILNDEAYSNFIETDGFKAIREKVVEYSLDELRTACDLQFAKEVKTTGKFSLNKKEEIKKKSSMFAFGAINHESNFLDSLLKK